MTQARGIASQCTCAFNGNASWCSTLDDGHAACRAGIACIVPPEGWEPPFALERGTNGQSAESFKFMIRKQLTSHLCMRVANTGKATRRAPSR